MSRGLYFDEVYTFFTATLFHKWNLDPEIVHIICYSDDPDGATPDEKRIAAEFELDLESYEKALDKVMNS